MLRLLFALTLCLSPALGQAQPYPSPTSPYVTDLAGLLNAEDMDEVRGMLSSLKSDTGIQMSVFTVESQAPYAPNETLEQFSTNLFNDWGVGDATRNDGILVIVLPDDQAMRIELGKGYDEQWNDVAGRVIDRSYLPSFRSDNYARGIKDGVADTIATLARPFAKGQPAPVNNDSTWLVILGILGALAFTFRRWIGDFAAKFRRCPNCQQRGAIHVSRDVQIKASPTANGSGRKTLHCSRCDHSERTTYVISHRSSSSSNRGFGGGRSSGGGASGRW